MPGSPESTEKGLDRAATAVRESDALLIAAGAGMGVDSGLPDFRGPEGFWRAYPAIARLGLRFEEMAQPHWFHQDPELAWAFYGHRLNLYRATMPHAGFLQLLALAQAKPHGYFVFTSNVDGHFQRAGFDSERVTECHGSLNHFQCCEPCTDEIWDASDQVVDIDEVAFRARAPLPRCRACGELARPNVMMFGDGDWIPLRTDEQQMRLERWLQSVHGAEGKLAIVELGAGTAIANVRRRSEIVAEVLDATLIRINPREPEVPDGGVGLALGAAEGIRRICERM